MKNLAKHLILVLLASCTLLFACKSKKSSIAGKYTLVLNKPKRLVTGQPSPILNMLKYADSRCPANADCVTMGNVAITIALTGNVNGNDDTFNLCLGDCKTATDNDLFIFNGVTYQIMLIEVKPYPGTSASANSTIEGVVEISKR